MSNLYFGELKKAFNKKAIIAFAIVFVALLIIIAVVFNVMGNIISGLEMDLTEEQAQVIKNIYRYSAEEVDEEIMMNEQLVAQYQKEYDKTGRCYAELQGAKGELAAFKYIKQKGLYDTDVRINGLNYFMLLNENAESFTMFYAGIILVIVMIYGAVLGASLYTNEYKSGTIKLVMVRPITKNRLTTAKLLAMYTILSALYLIPTFFGFIYGAIAFKVSGADVVYAVFNSTSAFASTAGALTFGKIFMGWIQIIVLATIAFSLGTITRKSPLGLLTALVIILGVGSFLNEFGPGAFFLSNAFNLMNYFEVSASIPKLGNFFISLAVLVFWYALSLVGLYVVTNKRDII